jgi:hypothetical protein
MEARVDLQDGYGKKPYPTKVRPESLQLVRMRLSDLHALVPYTTRRSFIRTLLDPSPTHLLGAEQELSFT